MADQETHDQKIAPPSSSPSPKTPAEKVEYDRESTSGGDVVVGDKGLGSEDGGSAEMVRELEKKITWKMDVYVVSIITLYYFLSFLDRANIGNAKVAGLQTDLKLTAMQYSTAITVTYVPYIFAELPSNLLLKRIGPHIWLPFIVTAWGLVTTLQGLVSSYTGLLVVRSFLGLAEGGILPGITLYLSGFYRRRQLQLRVAIFFTATSLAGAFSGLLAAAIVNMDGLGNRRGWQWIFILEGIFTVICGVATAPFLPRSPQHAWFFNAEEKAAHKRMLELDGMGEEADEEFSWKACASALLSPQAWLMSVGLFLSAEGLYGLAFFAPSIVNAFGYGQIQTQLRTVPPYVVSTFVGLVTAYVADRYQARGIVTSALALVGVAGYAMFLATGERNVSYASLFLQTIGAYGTAPALSAWNANNLANHYKKATGLVLGFIFSNSGGILSTWIFDTPPRYHKAALINLIFFIALVAVCFINMAWLAYQNGLKAKERERLAVEAKELGLSGEEVERRDKERLRLLGDRAPQFIYTL